MGYRGAVMQDLACELRRTLIPRTRVNKGKRKGRGNIPQPFLRPNFGDLPSTGFASLHDYVVGDVQREGAITRDREGSSERDYVLTFRQPFRQIHPDSVGRCGI
jgi:hypothetical protein